MSKVGINGFGRIGRLVLRRLIAGLTANLLHRLQNTLI